MLKKCTGAVSCRAPCERSEWRGYNLSRCQKFVMVQNYIACSYAYPGAGYITSPGKWLRVMQKAW